MLLMVNAWACMIEVTAVSKIVDVGDGSPEGDMPIMMGETNAQVVHAFSSAVACCSYAKRRRTAYMCDRAATTSLSEASMFERRVSIFDLFLQTIVVLI
jgi:hypothetical protein